MRWKVEFLDERVQAAKPVLQARVAMAWVTHHCMATMEQAARMVPALVETDAVAARWLASAERAEVVTRWAASPDVTRQVLAAAARAAACLVQAAKTTP